VVSEDEEAASERFRFKLLAHDAETSYRHSGESRNPGFQPSKTQYWTPAFAGVTTQTVGPVVELTA
jgi:hypothetical protein